ncbi:DUF2786 domain-containing protein [Amorphus orientalis]|uniref:DUF2786 domain-containing protein n=1 Tax=Amorphus orientalis TaxID=649198 RepID=A0AAE3VUB7_9HYPH|nr:DUF2786 domain-containing protein [Amorphus orientalis]MDQ0317751.1 hypothetical protein [Amorphus orientalis]
MVDKGKIAARIRALLAKTTENGCTEDEAVSAAAKAAEMLSRYNLTLDEVQVRESSFRRHREIYNDPVGERLWKVASAIADLTGCRYWKSPRGSSRETIDFFGFDHEVDVARYLLEICRNAMLRSQAQVNRRYGLLREGARRRKVNPFLDGMADRLAQRIRALKTAEPTGKGLVVLKGQLIDEALADAGIGIKQARARPSRKAEDTYVDGVRAGDEVALNPGVRGDQSIKLIR